MKGLITLIVTLINHLSQKRNLLIISALLSAFSHTLNAQTRTITGLVLDYDLSSIWGVRIQLADKLTLGETDSAGRFHISVPQNTQTLLFSWIGYEPTTIYLGPDCGTLEVIMQSRATYDFISSRKIDKDRLKDFNLWPHLYQQAYSKGLFKKSAPCYTRQFVPDKPSLDSIRREISEKQKRIKLAFKKFNVGDTVKIPFSGNYREDGTDRTKLIYYSFVAYMKKYDYVVQCIILEKNRYRRGLNLVCKITGIKLDKAPVVFNGKELKPGDIFTYNMRFFKILTKDERELWL